MSDSKDYSVLFVNPVPRKSAQGRHLQNYMILDPRTGEIIPGELKNKNREDSVGSAYGFLINFQTKKIMTGLDILLPNEFKGLEPYDIAQDNNLDYDKWKDLLEKIVTSDKIKKQTLYEILAGVDPNFYTNDINNIPLFSHGASFQKEEPPYLARFSITLYPRPNRFTDETPRSRLAMELVKNHPKIAKSEAEMNPDLHDFYISEEEEATRKKNEKKRLFKRATYELVRLEEEATKFRQYQIASLCTLPTGDPIITGDVANNKLEGALNGYISEDNPNYLSNIEKFLKLAELNKTKQGSEKLNIMYLIRQAMNEHIIVSRDGYFIWVKMQDKPNVGKFTDYDKMVSFFLKEKKNYIPQDSEVTNWYAELDRQVKVRGVRFD